MRWGTWLVWIGIGLAGVGLVVRYVPQLVSWFGSLPGDIRFRSGNATVYVPITSMLIVSVVLSLAATLVARLLR